MANNRMFLVHRPSGIGVMIGKNFGREWDWDPDNKNMNLQGFYDRIYQEGDPDNFVLLREDQGGWNYTEEFTDGFRIFKIYP